MLLSASQFPYLLGLPTPFLLDDLFELEVWSHYSSAIPSSAGKRPNCFTWLQRPCLVRLHLPSSLLSPSSVSFPLPTPHLPSQLVFTTLSPRGPVLCKLFVIFVLVITFAWNINPHLPTYSFLSGTVFHFSLLATHLPVIMLRFLWTLKNEQISLFLFPFLPFLFPPQPFSLSHTHIPLETLFCNYWVICLSPPLGYKQIGALFESSLYLSYLRKNLAYIRS